MLSLFKSAKDISKTRPFKLSAEISIQEEMMRGGGNFTLTSSLVARSDGRHSDIKDSRYMYIVPFLSCEGVDAIYLISNAQKQGLSLTSSSSDPSF